jgi:hypothetical protein
LTWIRSTNMSRNPWPAKAASVIILPSGERGQVLHAMAKSWSQSGILGQALWVMPKDDLNKSHDLAIEAQIFGRQKVVSVDLFQQLAQNPLSTLRILAVRLLVDQKDEDPIQDYVISALDRLTNVGVPVQTGTIGTTSSGTDVQRINMIMAPSWIEEVKHRSLTESRWTHNVIISPEDRTSPWGIDAFVREETNLYGITIANIASVGGLWMGTPKGSFEITSHNRSGIPGQIWLQRTFARGVLTEGLAVAQSVKALMAAADAESNNLRPEYGLQPEGIAILPDDQIANLISDMSANIFKLGDGALSYKAFKSDDESGRRKIGVIGQLVEFAKFAWNKTLMIPIWIFESVIGAVSRKFTKIFQGEEGDAEVDANIDLKRPLDKRDQEIANSIFDLDKRRLAALGPESKMQSSTLVRSTPELWANQRKYLFAMLDGSDGPAGISVPEKEQRRLVFGRLRDVVFDVNDEWQMPRVVSPEGFENPLLSDVKSIGWTNLLESKVLLESVQSDIGRIKAEIQNLESVPEPVISVEEPMQSTPVSEAVVPEQPQEVTPVIVDEVAPEEDLVEEEIAAETESEDSDVKN